MTREEVFKEVTGLEYTTDKVVCVVMDNKLVKLSVGFFTKALVVSTGVALSIYIPWEDLFLYTDENGNRSLQTITGFYLSLYGWEIKKITD